MSTKPIVIKGKLKLKGSSGSSSSSSLKKRKVEEEPVTAVTTEVEVDSVKTSKPDYESSLTATQRKHLEKKRDLESRCVKTMGGKTFRERVDAFNSKLSVMTEHNDVPRISAAGNG